MTRGAATITLRDVYRAVEAEPLCAVRPPNEQCSIGRGMPRVLARCFHEAEAAMEERLAQTTVADVIRAVFEDSAADRQCPHLPSPFPTPTQV